MRYRSSFRPYTINPVVFKERIYIYDSRFDCLDCFCLFFLLLLDSKKEYPKHLIKGRPSSRLLELLHRFYLFYKLISRLFFLAAIKFDINLLSESNHNKWC